jgi:hypothetical protein
MRGRTNVTGTAILFAILAFSAPTLPAQNSGDTTAWLQHVAGELRNLQTQLLQHRLEFQELTSSLLERDLGEIRRQQERLANQESAHARQVAHLDEQLAASPTQDERAQLEAARLALTGQEAQRLTSERSILNEREAEVQRRFHAARQRLEALRQMTQQSSAKPAGGSQ